MRTLFSRLWILGIPLLALVSACAGLGPANIRPLYNVEDVPFSNGPLETLSEAAGDIRRAATFLGWTVEEKGPNEILATNRKGKHAAVVTIRFDKKKFSINYRNSVLLDYDGAKIHKLYNLWVADLERTIQAETSLN